MVSPVLPCSCYLTPPLEVRALGLALTGVGWIPEQRRTWSRRALTTYAGVLVTAGAGRLSFQGSPGFQEVTHGTLFWLPPGIPHHYGPLPGTAWSEYWVLFEGPATSGYEELGFLGSRSHRVDATGAESIRATFVELLDTAGRPESVPTHVRAAALLHTLIAAAGASPNAEDSPATGTIGRRALDILARDAHLPVRISAVAAELAVSRDTLATEVRRCTGSTPSEYLTRYRITRAKALLAGSDQSIAAIARAVGYADPAYFSRVFTRTTGVAPSRFRRQQHAQPDITATL
ncbi:helix-turn-helix domain-containing protein [Streptomyces sp. NPDC020917]|uniref:helix-turn-helix domain-containing protein n=1 Tax=Streptomyces sp. NPDC020917 TaxID=3365102 RepID=UPI003787A855